MRKKTHITTLLMFVGIAINVGLNIPFIINWGIIGAAWATTISGIIMTIVGYFIAQRYVKITREWKPILVIYNFFLIAVVFSMISYDVSIYYHVSLAAKFVFLFVYLLFGLLSKSIIVLKK